MFFSNEITLPANLRVYAPGKESNLTPVSLTLGNTTYSEHEISGPIQFETTPRISTLSSDDQSMITKQYVEDSIASIFTQSRVWNGKNVFTTETLATVTLPELTTYTIQNVNLDFLLWVKAVSGAGILYLPTPVLYQKVTIRSDSSTAVQVTAPSGRIVFDANSYATETPTMTINNATVTLYCAVTSPGTWILINSSLSNGTHY
jgi:hypothetical protein